MGQVSATEQNKREGALCLRDFTLPGEATQMTMLKMSDLPFALFLVLILITTNYDNNNSLKFFIVGDAVTDK